MDRKQSISDLIDVVKRGIQKKYKGGKSKKVVIVGAGLAGLAAGYELKRAGHKIGRASCRERV